MTGNEAILTAGAMSSLASVLAVLAVRTTNKVARAQTLPVLAMAYNYQTNKLVVSNNGGGPALNLKLQATNLHYTDIKKITSLSLNAYGRTSVKPGESVEIGITQKTRKKGEEFKPLLPAGYSLMNVSKKLKRAGIIFNDITGKTYLAKMRFYEMPNYKYNLETAQINSYGLLQKLKDEIQVQVFVWGKKRREAKANKNTTGVK